jgi:hypothetical protein
LTFSNCEIIIFCFLGHYLCGNLSHSNRKKKSTRIFHNLINFSTLYFQRQLITPDRTISALCTEYICWLLPSRLCSNNTSQVL